MAVSKVVGISAVGLSHEVGSLAGKLEALLVVALIKKDLPHRHHAHGVIVVVVRLLGQINELI